MKRRLHLIMWLLWGGAVVGLVGLLIAPESYRLTRIATVTLAAVIWFGLLALVWRQRWVRFSLLALTVSAAMFLVLPSRRPVSNALRSDYVSALADYEGAPYHWGGENHRGIDCSGLVRRGLIDAMFRRGARTLDPGLIRRAIALWWNDCTAKALGEHYLNQTARVLDATSVNSLDHSQILPGDLAVTTNGVHIMAYLGDRRWIEADPGVGRVISVNAPCLSNGWFVVPMNIVRWRALQ